MLRIGWFSTGRDQAACHLLQAVWHSIKNGGVEAEIQFVFSNREPGDYRESDLFFNLVESYRIPLICLSSDKFKALPDWRPEFETEVMRRLEGYLPDLCLLAGYMLIVGQEMCQKYNMINLHPAAPGGPAGTWQEVIWKLIETGAEKTGVMMHLVTPELDKGPPVTYCTFSTRGDLFDRYWREIKEPGQKRQLFQLIRNEGVKKELPLVVATLKAFAEGRVRIEKGKVLSAQGQVIGGYDLTQEIENRLKEESGEPHLF